MTPQQIEAMKLALDWFTCYQDNSMSRNNAEALADEVMTAIKEALAEHAMREVQRLGQEIEPDDMASILACRDMLDAQPVPQRTEQEPVACERCKQLEEHAYDLVGELRVANIKLSMRPQRKPLTHEEIFACENSVPDEIVSDRDWCIHFARAIEAAHGIKENT